MIGGKYISGIQLYRHIIATNFKSFETCRIRIHGFQLLVCMWHILNELTILIFGTRARQALELQEAKYVHKKKYNVILNFKTNEPIACG